MTIPNRSSANAWIKWMRRAVQLASLGEGFTSPNPLVGAIVLDLGGQVVGDGFHGYAGGPHAEILALSQADKKAEGGTLVVTLEPCCHYGRTPPCTEAILKSGIKRVVIGLKDPDPRVSGGGVMALKNAGIEVISGVLENEVAYQNREFIFRVKTGRPWGILKCAMSLDGRIGLKNGKSKWISSEESRRSVHLLRSKCDAVIVGAGTVRADDPLLTSRGLSNPEPLRVVVTNSLDLPCNAKIFDTSTAQTLVAYGPDSALIKLDAFPEGAEFLKLKSSNPLEVLKLLANKGCNKVLWECGSRLATAAIKQNCVQELKLVLAPKILGGISAMTPFDDFGFTRMSEVLSMDQLSLIKEGNDIHISIISPQDFL